MSQSNTVHFYAKKNKHQLDNCSCFLQLIQAIDQFKNLTMKSSKSVIILETLLIIITALPLYVSLLTIWIVLGTFGLITRFIVKNIGKILHPEWDCIMTGKDVIVGADDLNCSRNILVWYDSLNAQISLEEVQNKFMEKIITKKFPNSHQLIYPKFQQYFEPFLGYNFWKWDKKFNIKNHIKLLDETEFTTERELLKKLGPLMTKSFEGEHPQWECFLIPNYIGQGAKNPKTLLLYRFHHAIADGYSILKCFMSNIGPENWEQKIITAKSSNPQKKSKNITIQQLILKILDTLWFFLRLPYSLARQTLIDIDSNEWFIPKNQLIGQSNLSMTRKISIHDIKSIAKYYNVTFSTVLYSSIGGAINKHFRNTSFGKHKRSISNKFRCFAPFPWKNHPSNQLTNHWSCASIPIFPGIDCHEERMAMIDEILVQLKNSPVPLGNYLLLPIASVLPNPLVKLGNWFNTAILSNFPGPTEYCTYYNKYPIDDMLFWAPCLNGKSGIGITVLSYAEHIRFGFNADKAILATQEDVDQICRYIEQEINKILLKISSNCQDKFLYQMKTLIEENHITSTTNKYIANKLKFQKQNLLRHRSVS